MATPLPPPTTILPAFLSADIDPPGTPGITGNYLPTGVARHPGPHIKNIGVDLILPYHQNIVPNSECVITLQWVMNPDGTPWPAPQQVVILPAIKLSTAGPTTVNIPYQNNKTKTEGLTLDPVIKITAKLSINGLVYGFTRALFVSLLA